ncbi:MAG: hypothetical protein ACJA0S_000657 [Rickettsiales bacterium]|jgi:hypothetical protein
MIRKFLIILYLIFPLTSCDAAKIVQSPIVSISKDRYQEISHKKYTHPFAIKSFENAEKFRKAQKYDMQQLHLKIVSSSLKNQIKFDQKLINKVRSNLQKELKYLQDFNNLSQNLTFFGLDESMVNPTLDPAYILPQVKYNKLDIFIKNSLKLSDSQLGKIISGKIITDIYSQKDLFPAPDSSHIRSDLTIPRTINVMLVSLKTIDKDIYGKYLQDNLNKSSLFYWYKNPRGININPGSIFGAGKGIIIPHNGYSFGGSMGTSNFRKNKFHTMPHDCSSYISHLIGLEFNPITKKPNMIWTSDMQNLKNLLLDENHISPKDLKHNLASYGLFSQKMDIVKIDDILSFQEGDLLMFRKFSDQKKKSSSLGNGGHIGVVLGTDEKDEIYIISYVRHYEKFSTGGFLISAISLKNLQNKFYSPSIFRLKNKVKNKVRINIYDRGCDLFYRDKTYQCQAGNEVRSGFFEIKEAFYNPDNIKNIKSELPLIKIRENYGWCKNKFSYLPESNCQPLNQYDLAIPINNGFLHIDQNIKPKHKNIILDKDDLLDLLS